MREPLLQKFITAPEVSDIIQLLNNLDISLEEIENAQMQLNYRKYVNVLLGLRQLYTDINDLFQIKLDANYTKHLIRKTVICKLIHNYIKNEIFILFSPNDEQKINPNSINDRAVYNAVKNALSELKDPNNKLYQQYVSFLPQTQIEKINNLTEKRVIDLLYYKPSRISALCCCGFFREYNPAEAYLHGIGVTKASLLSIHESNEEQNQRENIDRNIVNNLM